MPKELHRRRERRAEDLLREALERADPLEACLVAATSDHVRLSLALAGALDEALDELGPSLRTFENLERVMETFLKLNRQVDRFAQLEARLRQARARAAEGRPK